MRIKRLLFGVVIAYQFVFSYDFGGHYYVKYWAYEHPDTTDIVLVPINVNGITVMVPSGHGFPTDPGAAGKVTIEGIDENHNNIRDDVERAIALHFFDDPVARVYSRMIAKWYQDIIENPDMPLSRLQSKYTNITRANVCIDDYSRHRGGGRFVMPYVLDTYNRSKAYIRSLQTLKGTVLSGTPGITDRCTL